MNAALTTGQKEKIAGFVPFDFVDFEFELLLRLDFEHAGVDKCHQVLLVADSDVVAVR